MRPEMAGAQYEEGAYSHNLAPLYRVTHQVVTNLLLTSKQKFCFGLACFGLACLGQAKTELFKSINGRFVTT